MGTSTKLPAIIDKKLNEYNSKISKTALDNIQSALDKIDGNEWYTIGTDAVINNNYDLLKTKLQPAVTDTLNTTIAVYQPLLITQAVALLVVGFGIGYLTFKKR